MNDITSKEKCIIFIDTETSGHHVELYLKRASSCLGEIQKIILLPIFCKENDEIPTLYKMGFKVDFYTGIFNFSKKIIVLSNLYLVDRVVYMSLDLISTKELLLMSFKTRHYSTSIMFIKFGFRKEVINCKNLLKLLRSFAKTLIFIATAKDLKIGLIEQDSYWYLKKIINMNFKSKVIFMPDYSELINNYQHINFSGNFKILVMGYISERKGVIELLQALQLINHSVELNILGKFDCDYHSKVTKFLKNNNNQNLIVNIDIKKIEQSKYEEALLNSNLIWLGYKGKDIGSSGILVDTIKLQKNFIASKFGYMGWILKRYGFDKYLIDPSDSNDVRYLVDMMINCNKNKNKNYQLHDESNFNADHSVEIGINAWKFFLNVPIKC